MEFKYRIRDLRRTRDYTAEELGNLVGVSKYAVSMWENGHNQPNNDVLIKLSKIFNVTIDYILGISDIPNPQSITEDDFLVAFSGLSDELTEEQKNQMLSIAKSLAIANKSNKK